MSDDLEGKIRDRISGMFKGKCGYNMVTMDEIIVLNIHTYVGDPTPPILKIICSMINVGFKEPNTEVNEYEVTHSFRIPVSKESSDMINLAALGIL